MKKRDIFLIILWFLLVIPGIILYFAPLSWWFEYGAVDSYKAKVGEPLEFISQRKINIDVKQNYFDVLWCKNGSSEMKRIGEMKSSGGGAPTGGLFIFTAPWTFSYTPMEPTRCQLQSVIEYCPLPPILCKTQRVFGDVFDVD